MSRTLDEMQRDLNAETRAVVKALEDAGEARRTAGRLAMAGQAWWARANRVQLAR